MLKRYKCELPLELLLSKEIQNKLLILNEIYRTIDGFRIEELALKTSLSPKTVYKYIRDENELFYKLFEKPCIIKSMKNSTYHFKGDKNKFLTLRYLLIEQSETIQLLLELIPNSSVNKYNFCTKYFLSDSTLKKIIKKINSLFNYLNIRLITRKNEIYLIGNEPIIRYFFTAIVWRTYNGLKWPFESLLSTIKLTKFKRKLFMNSKYTVPLPIQDIFMVNLAISILRMNSSNRISKQQLPSYTKDITALFSNMDNFIKSLKKDFFFTETEIDFILLNTHLYPNREAIYEKNKLTLNVLENRNISAFNSCFKFINFIKDKHPDWDINSKSAKIVISSIISAHISLDLYKQACFNWQDLDLESFLDTSFPTLFPSIRKITQSINPDLSEDLTQALTFNLTKTYLLEFSPKDFEPEINIFLISDSPEYVSRETVSRIKLILRYKYNIKIDTQRLPDKFYDLIIATARYKDMPKNIPAVYVFPQIIEKDISKIKKACENLYVKKINNRSNIE